ncbi:DUF4431 domain-containing protein [Citrobacter sp. Cu231]|uniref:DUF4431 domain-containing protein n=1 Tax=Citrobacter werkmanii TaxID=67827 RepID=A0AA37ZCE7_9ENTR|nr:DUF4431 domain-containing protein [Citrobacter sp. Cu231]MDM2743113.1 DUF4431 domain-containing protein [Citrobacter sp. Cu231]HAT7594756.1 DUF4431 domain-containing protein [Citrobacter werkmanii]
MKGFLIVGAIGIFLSSVVRAECMSPGDYLAIHGVLRQVTYTGTAPGQKWVLFTEAKNNEVCAKNAPDGDKTKIQLAVDDEKAKAFEGKDVFAIGHLFYSTKAEEHTPLLLDVKDITTEDPNAPPPAVTAETTPKPEHRKPSKGKMSVRMACEQYMGVTGDSYGYLSTKDENYLVSAIQHAKNIGLSTDYVDYILKAISTNRKDASNASTIFSGQKLSKKNSLNSTEKYYKDQYDFMVIACITQPAQVIPSWNGLLQYDLIDLNAQ